MDSFKSARNWYYVQNQQSVGPVERSVLQELIDKGELKEDALVWREGMEDWSTVKTMFTGGMPPPVAAPVIPPLDTLVFDKALAMPDHGKFYSYSVILLLIPLATLVVRVLLCVYLCEEIDAARQKCRRENCPPNSFARLDKVLGCFLLGVFSGIGLPLVMYWRNQSRCFKPLPLWLFFIPLGLAVLILLTGLVSFTFLGITAQGH